MTKEEWCDIIEKHSGKEWGKRSREKEKAKKNENFSKKYLTNPESRDIINKSSENDKRESQQWGQA